MSDLRTMLREEAELMNLRLELPPGFRRRVLFRRATYVVAAAAIIAGAAAAVPVLRSTVPEETQPAARDDRGALASGKRYGLQWDLALQSRDAGCPVLRIRGETHGGRRSCGPNTAGFTTLVAHSNLLGEAVVFGAVPAGGSVIVSVEGGGFFAAPIYPGPERSGMDYYVWFSYKERTSGRVQAEGRDGVIGTHEFQSARRGETVTTGTGIVTSSELFGNEFGPGEKFALHSDWWVNGYYTFLLRRYLDKSCLHFEGSSRCATTESLGDGFQLVLVGAEDGARFVGGLIGDDVEAIKFHIGGEATEVPVKVLESETVRVRYFASGEPFSRTSPGRFVAYGADGEVVDSMWVGRRDPP